MSKNASFPIIDLLICPKETNCENFIEFEIGWNVFNIFVKKSFFLTLYISETKRFRTYVMKQKKFFMASATPKSLSVYLAQSYTKYIFKIKASFSRLHCILYRVFFKFMYLLKVTRVYDFKKRMASNFALNSKIL